MRESIPNLPCRNKSLTKREDDGDCQHHGDRFAIEQGGRESPLLNGLDAAEQLKTLHPAMKVIVLTQNREPRFAVEAFRRHASGYLLKDSAASELTTAIREALRGKSYVSPTIAKGMADEASAPHAGQTELRDLSAREREVLQLLAEGKSMKEVAGILDLTPRTVAFHKYRMMEQLRVKTSAELVQFAVREGMVG